MDKHPFKGLLEKNAMFLEPALLQHDVRSSLAKLYDLPETPDRSGKFVNLQTYRANCKFQEINNTPYLNPTTLRTAMSVFDDSLQNDLDLVTRAFRENDEIRIIKKDIDMGLQDPEHLGSFDIPSHMSSFLHDRKNPHHPANARVTKQSKSGIKSNQEASLPVAGNMQPFFEASDPPGQQEAIPYTEEPYTPAEAARFEAVPPPKVIPPPDVGSDPTRSDRYVGDDRSKRRDQPSSRPRYSSVSRERSSSASFDTAPPTSNKRRLSDSDYDARRDRRPSNRRYN